VGFIVPAAAVGRSHRTAAARMLGIRFCRPTRSRRCVLRSTRFSIPRGGPGLGSSQRFPSLHSAPCGLLEARGIIPRRPIRCRPHSSSVAANPSTIELRSQHQDAAGNGTPRGATPPPPPDRFRRSDSECGLKGEDALSCDAPGDRGPARSSAEASRSDQSILRVVSPLHPNGSPELFRGGEIAPRHGRRGTVSRTVAQTA
jgi:hypothetical protein